MIEIGDKVRIGESGGSVFVVRAIDPDEGRAVIEPTDENAAGGYPFSMPLGALTPLDTDA